jgi:hypothetical protein
MTSAGHHFVSLGGIASLRSGLCWVGAFDCFAGAAFGPCPVLLVPLGIMSYSAILFCLFEFCHEKITGRLFVQDTLRVFARRPLSGYAMRCDVM